MEQIANKYLIEAYGNDATFREGQLEAILSVLERGNELIVRQTGWGKSLIYFILTNIYRSQGLGPTIIVSPLLSLVRNQIYNAKKFNLNAVNLSSDNRDSWDDVYKQLESNSVDVLFLTPEHLANKDNMNKIYEVLARDFALLVIDEAHCISDWGHDFRPDYKKIVSFISSLNYKIPIVATTATANDRVIDDISEQLNVVNVSRGPLVRESLRIQVLNITTKIDRYAWILGYLKNVNKSGIIYCITQKDTEDLNRFLVNNGINSASYNGSSDDRFEVEERFLNNELTCVVATIALGMGYDKQDIGFVIHYQRPGNIVAYYQQIGRAGRSLDEADVIMLNGREDEIIQRHFIDDAFPKIKDIEDVKEAIKNLNSPSFKVYEIQRGLNIKNNKLDQIIKYLMDNEVIDKVGPSYYVEDLNKVLNYKLFEEVTKMRYGELEQMKDFIKLDTCYMKYLAHSLSDYDAKDCGKCANCLKANIYEDTILEDNLKLSTNFINNLKYDITPRKQLPIGVKYQGISRFKTKAKDYTNLVGQALTFEDEGLLGQLVKSLLDTKTLITDEVMEDFANLIKSNTSLDESFVITYIPSNTNNDVLKDLTIRLSKFLNISFVELININIRSTKQSKFNNAYKWFDNAISKYNIIESIDNRNVILIDDFYETKWTLTSVGLKLMLAGANSVTPFTLVAKNNY